MPHRCEGFSLISFKLHFNSFDYEEAEPEVVVLEKVDFKLNGAPVDELSFGKNLINGDSLHVARHIL